MKTCFEAHSVYNIVKTSLINENSNVLRAFTKCELNSAKIKAPEIQSISTIIIPVVSGFFSLGCWSLIRYNFAKVVFMQYGNVLSMWTETNSLVFRQSNYSQLLLKARASIWKAAHSNQ